MTDEHTKRERTLSRAVNDGRRSGGGGGGGTRQTRRRPKGYYDLGDLARHFHLNTIRDNAPGNPQQQPRGAQSGPFRTAARNPLSYRLVHARSGGNNNSNNNNIIIFVFIRIIDARPAALPGFTWQCGKREKSFAFRRRRHPQSLKISHPPSWPARSFCRLTFDVLF